VLAANRKPLFCTLRTRKRCAVLGADGAVKRVHHILNEAVLDRGAFPSSVFLEVFIDGSFVTAAEADGLIIATPRCVVRWRVCRAALQLSTAALWRACCSTLPPPPFLRPALQWLHGLLNVCWWEHGGAQRARHTADAAVPAQPVLPAADHP
jgi:NAD+ kinase